MQLALHNYRAKMIYKLFKNISLIIIAIVIAGFIDVTVSKIGWPPFGGFVGGLLIGLSSKNREILYGAFGGVLYVVLMFVVAVAIGLGVKLSIREALGTLLLSIRTADFLRLFSIMVFFIFGALIGRILKDKKKRGSEKGK